jgi:long-subunit acyl-CoA synthetase (AMP-forming)
LDGYTVPLGSVGELWVKGYNVMKGYWQNPSATKEAIEDGWMKTGDLAVQQNLNYILILF